MGNQQGRPEKGSLEGRDVRLDQRVSVQLARGVKYNMKILIRGERQCGKTQLLRRLQELPFQAKYEPSPEICTAHLIWEVPETDDAVKVEVWDVVDKGIQPHVEWAGVTGAGGKEQEASAAQNVVLLDASTINVYQGCDGVIVCYDPSRRSTWDYVVSLVKKASKETPILIAANFRDKGKGDAVEKAEVDKLLKSRERTSWIQLSCLHNFGVEDVRAFLLVPFMVMKHRSAERQLKITNDSLDRTRDKLDAYADTLNYDVHCKQWAAGGAQLARQQAQRMQAMQKSAQDKRAETLSPGGSKKKMVPVSELMPTPKVDEFAPDLGKEVASFNTGKIDESFFSSDDELDGQMAVIEGSDDDEPNSEMLKDENISDEGEPGAHAPASAKESAARQKQADREEQKQADKEEQEQEQAALKAEEERKRREDLEREERLKKARQQAEEKRKAEEDKLNEEMAALNAGGLDGFLDSDDDGGGDGWGSAQVSDGDSDAGKGGGAGGGGSDDSDDDGHRPEIMADEDLSDDD